MRVVVVTCGMLAVLATAASASVTYQDGTFAAGDWVIETMQVGGGGSGSAVQNPTSGLPGAARRVTTNVNAPAGSSVTLFHRYGASLATRYEPGVQGEIGSVNFDIDAKMVSGFGQGQRVTVALKQGQVVFLGPGDVTGSSGSWVHLSFHGASAADFVRADGQAGNPDFSTTGAPIRFGFSTSNTTTGGAYQIVVDYDNFQLGVFPPCPADFNRDGGVDGADVSAFFAAWESGSSSADVNLDGGVDGADVGAFFALWESGGC